MRADLRLLRFVACALLGATSPCRAAPERAFPTLVGSHGNGSLHFEAFRRLGFGNFVWIPKTNCPEGLAHGLGYPKSGWGLQHQEAVLRYAEDAAAAGFSFMVSARRGLGDAVRAGGPDHGGDGSGELLAEDLVRELKARHGDRFIGLHLEEMDIDFVQNGARPPYRRRADLPAIYAFRTRSEGRRRFEAEMRRLCDRYHRWGVRALPNCAMGLQHSAYRAGADLVLGELGEHLPSTSVQLAYLRGAGAQFGRPWGVWVSPWYRGTVPSEDTSLWRAAWAKPGGGHTASDFERHALLALFSGAAIVTHQCTEPVLRRGDTGALEPAAWGRVLQRVARLSRTLRLRRASPARVALLVDRDNGWTSGGNWGGWIGRDPVWSILPADRSDRMLRDTLDLFYPGYARSGTTDIGPADGAYPGYFTDAPLGEADVLHSDASMAVLRRYRAIIAAGGLRVDAALARRLEACARLGGTVVLNAAHLRGLPASTWRRLCGATPPGGSVRGSVVRGLAPGWPSGRWTEGPFTVSRVRPAGARVLADDGAGRPVALRNELGRGRVVLTTPEWLLAERPPGAAPPARWNVALASAGAVTSASCPPRAPGWDVDRLNDGRTGGHETAWVAATEAALPADLTVRLARPSPIAAVGVACAHGPGQGPTRVEALLSEDGAAWRAAASATLRWERNDGVSEEREIALDGATARWVRVRVLAANRQWGGFAVDELRVWSRSMPPGTPQGTEQAAMLGYGRALLAAIAAPFAPVRAAPAAGIQALLATDGVGAPALLVANHARKPWRGTITVRSAAGGSVREALTGRPVAATRRSGALRVALALAPESVAVLRVGARHARVPSQAPAARTAPPRPPALEVRFARPVSPRTLRMLCAHGAVEAPAETEVRVRDGQGSWRPAGVWRPEWRGRGAEPEASEHALPDLGPVTAVRLVVRRLAPGSARVRVDELEALDAEGRNLAAASAGARALATVPGLGRGFAAERMNDGRVPSPTPSGWSAAWPPRSPLVLTLTLARPARPSALLVRAVHPLSQAPTRLRVSLGWGEGPWREAADARLVWDERESVAGERRVTWAAREAARVRVEPLDGSGFWGRVAIDEITVLDEGGRPLSGPGSGARVTVEGEPAGGDALCDGRWLEAPPPFLTRRLAERANGSGPRSARREGSRAASPRRPRTRSSAGR